MDQKNTIVKCAMHKCLFNHCGTCDQYVITIGVDGKCTAYCETELPVEQKTCHEDCIHFDDSDPMVGPMCLFKHPEPLKEFYEGMPCDYYYALHKKPLRGWRAKGAFLEDTVIDEELHERFKIFLNNWIKEHPPLSKEDQEIMNDIGYIPPKYPNYEECWICQHGGSNNMYCSLSIIPMRGSDGKCCRFSRRSDK